MKFLLYILFHLIVSACDNMIFLRPELFLFLVDMSSSATFINGVIDSYFTK